MDLVLLFVEREKKMTLGLEKKKEKESSLKKREKPPPALLHTPGVLSLSLPLPSHISSQRPIWHARPRKSIGKEKRKKKRKKKKQKEKIDRKKKN